MLSWIAWTAIPPFPGQRSEVPDANRPIEGQETLGTGAGGGGKSLNRVRHCVDCLNDSGTGVLFPSEGFGGYSTSLPYLLT